jgi:hypothetical protein
MQVGAMRLGSNTTLTSTVLVFFGSPFPTTASSIPLGIVKDRTGAGCLERCAQESIPVSGPKPFARDGDGELYPEFCNIVGGVSRPAVSMMRIAPPLIKATVMASGYIDRRGAKSPTSLLDTLEAALPMVLLVLS